MSYALVPVDPDANAQLIADTEARTEITALFEGTEVAVVVAVETELDISRMMFVTRAVDADGKTVWRAEEEYYVVMDRRAQCR